MLKLIKYEFRRSRTSLIVMLAVALVLYLAAPLGSLLKRAGLMALSRVALMFY